MGGGLRRATAVAGCAGMDAAPGAAKVVVIGGGFGGATAARHVKLWAPDIDVTVVERNAEFVSCPISNLVLAGNTQLSNLTVGYDALRQRGRAHGARRGGLRRSRGAAGAARGRQHAFLRPADRLARRRFHLRPAPGPAERRGAEPRASRVEGRAADCGAAQAARGDARRRRVRVPHPDGALSLPARAVRARVPGGGLFQAGEAEVQDHRARFEPGHRFEAGAVPRGVEGHVQGPDRLPSEQRARRRGREGHGGQAHVRQREGRRAERGAAAPRRRHRAEDRA